MRILDIDQFIYRLEKIKDSPILRNNIILREKWLKEIIMEMKEIKVEFKKNTEIKNLEKRIEKLNKYTKFEIMDI